MRLYCLFLVMMLVLVSCNPTASVDQNVTPKTIDHSAPLTEEQMIDELMEDRLDDAFIDLDKIDYSLLD